MRTAWLVLLVLGLGLATTYVNDRAIDYQCKQDLSRPTFFYDDHETTSPTIAGPVEGNYARQLNPLRILDYFEGVSVA